MIKKLKSKYSGRKDRDEFVELVQVERSDAISLSTLESGVSKLKNNGSKILNEHRGQFSETGSEISSGPQKWRRIRRGPHLSYMPFDIEDYSDSGGNDPPFDDTFPPLSEYLDNSKNWPKNCPFLHLKFTDFAILDKQRFIKHAYYFWYYLVFLFTWDVMGAIIAALISPTPSPEQVYFNFVFGFLGFWCFFFGHFRLLYLAMRSRKSWLYILYEFETVVLLFLTIFMIFSLLGNMVQLLAPLAPGSPVPVRQQPLVPAVVQSVGIFFWAIALCMCFYFIRKAHYFNQLSLADEKEIWLREKEPTFIESSKKRFLNWLIEKFGEKPDPPQPPVRCGMLQGRDLWLQGQLTLETVFIEFKADIHIFDHLVWERIHFHEVKEIRKYSETGILIRIINPSKRETDDLDYIFDYNDRELRTHQYKIARKLWKKVDKNMSLLSQIWENKLKKMKRPIDMPEQDVVEAFNKARKNETKERAKAHMVTYKDWQKLLGGVSIHILSAGEVLLETGEEFDKLYHLAQGRIEVSEYVEGSWSKDGSESPNTYPSKKSSSPMLSDPVHFEQRTWANYSKIRKERGIAERNEIEYEDPRIDDYREKDMRRALNESVSTQKEKDETFSSDESSGSEVSDSTSSHQITESAYSGEESGSYSAEKTAIYGPETVLLCSLRKDDIFGVVPFLLSRGNQKPKSGLTFVAQDPITVVFSLDAEFTKKEILKPKKEVTAAFYKYLALILGERTEAAEDAMFMRKIREKRLDLARAEESMLAKRRQADEESALNHKRLNPSLSKDEEMQKLFNFSAIEKEVDRRKGIYTFNDSDSNDKQIIKVNGTFYLTSNFFAFCGKKLYDTSRMEINRCVYDVMRHDDVISVRIEGKKGIIFTDLRIERKILELKNSKERDEFYEIVVSKWRSENEATSKEMRHLLRRKMTRLSLNYLSHAERVTQQSIEGFMASMTEKEKKQLFAGSRPIELSRNQIVISELNLNDNLFLLCTGIVRVQRVREQIDDGYESGWAMDRVVFQEIPSGQIFGFDSFLTGAPAYSSFVVDSEKCTVRSCTKEQIMARLREDKKLTAKFYMMAAVSLAARLSELSPLDLFL